MSSFVGGHEWRKGPGRPGPDPKCGACGVRKSQHGTPKEVKLLKLKDVAAILGIHYRTVWRLRDRGVLDVIYVGTKSPRVRSTDLERLVA